MARYLSNIDLANNQLQNAALHPTGTAPSNPVEGQIYFNNTSDKLFIYDGSAWLDLTGDISEVIAGDGLTGGGSNASVTLDVGAGTGITVNANDIAITNTGVTAGSYGSSSAIPTFTVNAQGQLTAAGTVSITTTLDIAADSGTDDGVVLGTDTLTISGTSNEIETSVSGDTITVGLVDNPTISGNLIVSGNLTVSGTTTTVNTETINLADNIITLNSNYTGSSPSENGGIEIERGTVDNVSIRWNETNDIWELTEDGTNFEQIQTVNNSTYATSIGDGSNTSYTVTHNLGTRDVIVQLFDNSSYDTVFADVERTSTTALTITFGSAPTTNDIRVLVSKIG